MKTVDLIKLIQERNNVRSAYAVAGLFGVMPPVAYHWAKGSRIMSDDFLPRAAELAGLPLAQVACWIAAERSHEQDVKAAFRKAAQTLASFAIVAINLQLPMHEMPQLQVLGQCILCQLTRAARFLRRQIALKSALWRPLHCATTGGIQ